MPDISMCKNETCPKRTKCYRFMAVPNQRQSYAGFSDSEDKPCHAFAALGPGDHVLTAEHIAFCKPCAKDLEAMCTPRKK
jgi:hypothetical protein